MYNQQNNDKFDGILNIKSMTMSIRETVNNILPHLKATYTNKKS